MLSREKCPYCSANSKFTLGFSIFRVEFVVFEKTKNKRKERMAGIQEDYYKIFICKKCISYFKSESSYSRDYQSVKDYVKNLKDMSPIPPELVIALNKKSAEMKYTNFYSFSIVWSGGINLSRPYMEVFTNNIKSNIDQVKAFLLKSENFSKFDEVLRKFLYETFTSEMIKNLKKRYKKMKTFKKLDPEDIDFVMLSKFHPMILNWDLSNPLQCNALKPDEWVWGKI